MEEALRRGGPLSSSIVVKKNMFVGLLCAKGRRLVLYERVNGQLCFVNNFFSTLMGSFIIPWDFILDVSKFGFIR